MNAIRIRKTIDSDTLHIPELGQFMVARLTLSLWSNLRRFRCFRELFPAQATGTHFIVPPCHCMKPMTTIVYNLLRGNRHARSN